MFFFFFFFQAEDGIRDLTVTGVQTCALPISIIADLTGLTGGALLCRYLLDMPLTQYVSRVNEAIASPTFWVGLVKAPGFAVLIALAGCYCGPPGRGSARGDRKSGV